MFAFIQEPDQTIVVPLVKRNSYLVFEKMGENWNGNLHGHDSSRESRKKTDQYRRFKRINPSRIFCLVVEKNGRI